MLRIKRPAGVSGPCLIAQSHGEAGEVSLPRPTVAYLGKAVGQGLVRPVQAKVEAFETFPPPTTKELDDGLLPRVLQEL